MLCISDYKFCNNQYYNNFNVDKLFLLFRNIQWVRPIDMRDNILC